MDLELLSAFAKDCISKQGSAVAGMVCHNN